MTYFYKYSVLIAYSFVLLCVVNAYISEDLIVVTDIGSIRGLRADDGNYTSFMGIPFAKVNESNVFGDAIPQEPFDGVFEANDDSAICPQIEEFNYTTVGSLDCLHLNVYVPDTDTSQNLLPVMVYIYGGRFSIGFAGSFLYGPKYIVRHDVILVTISYRLGPYGFMCLDIPEIPGNAGLKDQVLALRWVQRNIESFGGDPNQVTLFGNSAGGMSAGYHLISETESLFANFISQSGPVSSLGPNNLITAPIILAEALGYITDDLNEAINYLNSADVHEVIEATSASGITLGPCLEKEFPGVERFLAVNGINSEYLKAPDMAVMLGYNSEESLANFPGNEGPAHWLMWEQLLLMSFFESRFNFEENQRNEIYNLVRRFYLGDEEINNDVRQQIIDFSSDIIFVYPQIRLIDPYIEAGVEKIYQYLFSYDGDRNFAKIKDNMTVPGVAHADEIGYLFSMDFIPEEPSENDQLIIDRLTTMWTNFAKYRDPTPETNLLLPVKWEPITAGSPYHYLNINLEMTAGQRFEYRRMAFWDLFYKTYATYEVGYISNDSEDAVPDSSSFTSFHPLLIIIVLLVNLTNV